MSEQKEWKYSDGYAGRIQMTGNELNGQPENVSNSIRLKRTPDKRMRILRTER